jgi:RNA polymerase sigma factor (sigma-70 family)
MADQAVTTAPHDPADLRARLIAEYIAMRPELVRFLAARLGGGATAEDIYQDMFFRLESANLPPEVSNPRAFLYKIAANLCGDHRRSGHRRQTRDGQWHDAVTHKVGPEPVADQVDAVDAIDSRRRLEAIVAATTELSPKCREVFVLHKIHELSHSEVAERLGITKKTIEKHMTTALKHLASRLWAGKSSS